MTAVVLVARAAIRRQWRGLVAVTLLIGIAGAVVLAAAAGARRTATSLERFREFSRSGDVELDLDAATARQLDRFRRVHNVAGVGLLRQMTLAYPDGTLMPAAAAVDATFGTVVDRPRVIEGRLPRPTDAHELAIGESLAATLHVRVGDHVTFDSYSTQQTDAAKTGAEAGPPGGPRVRFHVVGLVRRPLDLGVSGGFGGVVIPTPAFYERYQNEVGSFVGALLRVRATHGAADVPQIVRSARRIFGESLFQVLGVGTETEGARDAINVLTAALWIFAAVAALAGLTAVGIVVIRQLGSVRPDQEVLAALGLAGRQRAIAAGALVVPAAVAGGFLAVIGAALASPLLPLGVAREAEVDPGFRIDGLALGLGFVAAVSFVLLVAAVAAWRVARSVARGRDEGRVRPSAAARAAASAGATPTLTTGLRMALEPGRGPTAVPVRSAFVGATLGTLGIVAVLVFGTSLDDLVATPRLYGWSWDTVVDPARAPQFTKPGRCSSVKTEVADDPAFDAVEAACLEAVEVDGHPVTGWGFLSLRNSIDPTIVDGRAPRDNGEIALGSAVLDAIGKRVGDTVQVRGARRRSFRIVGQVVLPSLARDDPEPLAGGAAFTVVGLEQLFDPSESVPNAALLGRFAPDVDTTGLALTRSGRWKLATGFGTRPSVPVEVDRLRQVDDLPLILGGLLALLATVAVAHAVVLATRRRRRDLAVLRTIGFERRDVRATIAYQATVLGLVGLVVGVPAGIAVGRVVWGAVADGLGVPSEVGVPLVALVLVAVGALLVANVIGGIAATSAIRDRPAAALAAE